ncbi:hypothetical protein BD626DRAFT_474801 [Schizophyllum amplum]|uniref:Uncharacterized protein n=1 Tax=Schizophyllum amplum TaxID=97359 RepID=A0A550CXZ6_9AGAR|nr:hypothetical protein BD626DRAFT_474801 [Auriculariopsis ampla]
MYSIYRSPQTRRPHRAEKRRNGGKRRVPKIAGSRSNQTSRKLICNQQKTLPQSKLHW